MSWDASWKEKLRIEVFPAAKTESKFEYFTGDKAETIRVTPGTDGVGIEFGELGADGTLEVYAKNVKGLTPQTERSYAKERTTHMIAPRKD